MPRGGRSSGSSSSTHTSDSGRSVTSGRGSGGSGSSRASSSSGSRLSSSSTRSASSSSSSSNSSTHRGGDGFGGPGVSSRSYDDDDDGISFFRAPHGGYDYDDGNEVNISLAYIETSHLTTGVGSSGANSAIVDFFMSFVCALVPGLILLALIPSSCTPENFRSPSSHVILSPVAQLSNAREEAARVERESSRQQEVSQSNSREKLDVSAYEMSDVWFDDRAVWIDDETALMEGLQYFYDTTGSQPYLVIANDVDGKTDFSDAEGEAWAEAIYDEMFDDEYHTLVAFVEYEESEYAYYIIVGRDAQSVIDEDVQREIAHAIQYYYTDPSLDDSEYFGKVFTVAVR